MPCAVDNTKQNEPNEGKLSSYETAVVPPARKGEGKAKEKQGKYKDLAEYHDFIIEQLKEEVHQAAIIRCLWEKGYQGSRASANDYIKQVREKNGITASRYKSKGQKKAVSGIRICGRELTEKELMKYIWQGKEIPFEEREAIRESHPNLLRTRNFVKRFKKIFKEKNMPDLYLLIKEYRESPIKRLSRFVQGMESDLEAIENAVASEKSNGFVEGINNKIKMIKRIMFGRSGQLLLAAKLMFQKWACT